MSDRGSSRAFYQIFVPKVECAAVEKLFLFLVAEFLSPDPNVFLA
jgi:hypothetical protein